MKANSILVYINKSKASCLQEMFLYVCFMLVTLHSEYHTLWVFSEKAIDKVVQVQLARGLEYIM